MNDACMVDRMFTRSDTQLNLLILHTSVEAGAHHAPAWLKPINGTQLHLHAEVGGA